MKLTNIYIKPDINGFSVLSFDDGKKSSKLVNYKQEKSFKKTEEYKL